jgi:hypothetical protein
VIEIGTLEGLIFHASRGLLTLKYGVALQSLLVEEIFSIHISLALHCNIEDLKGSSLPEVIAGVDQLVDSAVEASFLNQLATAEPLSKTVQVQFVFFS